RESADRIADGSTEQRDIQRKRLSAGSAEGEAGSARSPFDSTVDASGKDRAGKAEPIEAAEPEGTGGTAPVGLMIRSPLGWVEEPARLKTKASQHALLRPEGELECAHRGKGGCRAATKVEGK